MTTVKNRQVNQPDQYIPIMDSNDSNSLSVANGILGPGTIPLGGMVAVMPNIDVLKAWQPPATGVIKDGFMRADGVTISASHVALGCKLTVGTVLPNMVAKYPKGGTTSGTTGGANGIYLTANQIPQISNTTSGGSAHNHTLHDGGHAHTIRWSKDNAIMVGEDNGAGSNGVLINAGRVNSYYYWGTDARGVNISLDDESGHTHSFSVGTPSPTIVDNQPSFVEVVYVIRVK